MQFMLDLIKFNIEQLACVGCLHKMYILEIVSFKHLQYSDSVRYIDLIYWLDTWVLVAQ